jgi:hypothetical protein
MALLVIGVSEERLYVTRASGFESLRRVPRLRTMHSQGVREIREEFGNFGQATAPN